MANRSDTDIVYGWLSVQDVPRGQDLTVFCTQASLIVTTYVEPNTDYDEAIYVSIETFLACHYATLKYRMTTYTSQAGASDTFMETSYLAEARKLDPDGTIPEDKPTPQFKTYGNFEDFEL